MDLQEASVHVEEMLENTKVVYMKTDPEVMDFTCHQPGKILLIGGKKRVEIDVDQDSVALVMGFLSCSVFDKENISTLLAWNLKSLMSYFRFYVKTPPVITTSVVDLQVIEKFLGIEKSAPENLSEAVNRMKVIAEYKNWKGLYQRLHLPLMLRVLPALETTPLLDEFNKTSVYAFYEVEGQHNGRLRCAKKFSKSYLPHTLDDEQKKNLKPKGYDRCLMTFDIRHCEVSVLQWLSKDEKLKEIIDSGKDLYHEIYNLVTGDVCDSAKKRDMTKLMFLPVMYGCGNETLGRNLNISPDVAKELIGRIHAIFPTVSEWMLAVQEKARHNESIEDYFGRPRSYPEKFYQARNFVVQGVAATVCLEKLIDIYKALKEKDAQLCFSIHDGYGIILNVRIVVDMYREVRKIIETESELCPGLLFKAECKVGKRLDAMRVIGKSSNHT